MTSAAEESFVFMCEINGLADGMTREHRFHPTRKWRFDFAWVDQMVAVEIEGVQANGKARHQMIGGFLADCEKYEEALALGWKVMRVPAPWIFKGKRHVHRSRTLEVLKQLLTPPEGLPEQLPA